MYIYTINPVTPSHFEAVKKQMIELGTPTIRAVWCGDHYKAVEGSHRLFAAQELGMDVEIIEVEENDIIAHDIDDLPKLATAADILNYGSYMQSVNVDII